MRAAPAPAAEPPRGRLEAAQAPASGGGGITVSAPVSIHIDGNAGPDTVEALRAYGEELKQSITEHVMRALEDARADAQRRAY